MTRAEEQLAALLDEVDSPMWIITAAHGGQRAGCLMSFATRVSLDPVRFLACVSKPNHTWRLAMAASHVAVHVAPDTPGLELARLFGERSGDDIDKFSRCAWREGPEGQPLLAGCPGWFVGRVLGRYDLGDHTGLLLEPVAAGGDGRGALASRRAQVLHAAH